MSSDKFGWQHAAEEAQAKLADAERRTTAAEKRAAEAEALAQRERIRREESDRRFEDHPNTSWADLYADRDAWRAAFLEAATTASIEGVSLIGWYTRAVELQQRLDAIQALVGKPLVERPELLPRIRGGEAAQAAEVRGCQTSCGGDCGGTCRAGTPSGGVEVGVSKLFFQPGDLLRNNSRFDEPSSMVRAEFSIAQGGDVDMRCVCRFVEFDEAGAAVFAWEKKCPVHLTLPGGGMRLW